MPNDLLNTRREKEKMLFTYVDGDKESLINWLPTSLSLFKCHCNDCVWSQFSGKQGQTTQSEPGFQRDISSIKKTASNILNFLENMTHKS